LGLSKPVLRLLIREASAARLRGPVLTLGRQSIDCSGRTLTKLFAEEGWRQQAPGKLKDLKAGEVTDTAFFHSLNIESVSALDRDLAEGATICADLNTPIPENLHGKFATIIDGGTLEHVFDVPQTLQSIASMLAEDGRVVHISPVNSWVNHGFYQFSPTFFWDFYGANGFNDLRCLLVEQASCLGFGERSRCYEYVGKSHPLITSKNRLLVFFSARKSAATPAKVLRPLQSYYVKTEAPTPSVPRFPFLDRPLGRPLKRLLKAWFPRLAWPRRPWGLTFLGYL